MTHDSIEDLLRGLSSRSPELAWANFLEEYARVILQVVHLFEREPDQVSDAFLYVCEELSRGQFRRLRKFRPQGPAKFSTWLRAVVRNLCLDWHRREYGRQRPFQSISKLSLLEQGVFEFVFERGFSQEEALLHMLPRFPLLDRHKVEAIVESITKLLTPRQFWLLSLRRAPRLLQIDPPGDDVDVVASQIADDRPNPEEEAGLAEQQAALREAVKRLPREERLILRLRFEDDLTLAQVARLVRLPDAQTADRRIREILSRLRKEIGDNG